MIPNCPRTILSPVEFLSNFFRRLQTPFFRRKIIRGTKNRKVLRIERFQKSFINLSHGFTANQIDPFLFMSHRFSIEQRYWLINKNYLLSVIFHDKRYIINIFVE